MTESADDGRERLVDDLAAVLAEAEEMLKRASVETGDKARDLRSQVETQLLRAKLKLQEIEGEAIDHAKAAARATDDYVHDHPWQAIGIAAVGGPSRRPADEPPLGARGRDRRHASARPARPQGARRRVSPRRCSASDERGSSSPRSSSRRCARARRRISPSCVVAAIVLRVHHPRGVDARGRACFWDTHRIAALVRRDASSTR